MDRHRRSIAHPLSGFRGPPVGVRPSGASGPVELLFETDQDIDLRTAVSSSTNLSGGTNIGVELLGKSWPAARTPLKLHDGTASTLRCCPNSSQDCLPSFSSLKSTFKFMTPSQQSL